MSEKSGESQSGGVSISGSVGSVGGDIVGRDKILGVSSAMDLEGPLRALAELIRQAPTEKRSDAEIALTKLNQEISKGTKADDSLMARLIKGIVALVPTATSAVVGAFATPILAGIAGPVTKYVLDELRGE